jgi:hypothetical protein
MTCSSWSSAGGRGRAAKDEINHESPGAREEWEKLENRFPSELEIRRGIIALSKPELDEMRSKVRRFRDILAIGHRSPQVAGAFHRDLDDGDQVAAAVGEGGPSPS